MNSTVTCSHIPSILNVCIFSRLGIVPSNNASCISNLGASSFLTEMGSPKKRKPDPVIQNNSKSAKRVRKSKEDTQKETQKEIEDLAALEKENKELEDEET